MGKRGHEHIIALELHLAEFFHFLLHAAVFEPLLPFGVCLEVGNVDGFAREFRQIGPHLHDARNDFVLDLALYVVGVARAHQLHLHGSQVACCVWRVANSLKELRDVCRNRGTARIGFHDQNGRRDGAHLHLDVRAVEVEFEQQRQLCLIVECERPHQQGRDQQCFHVPGHLVERKKVDEFLLL